jgi:trk system potassium uptake protein TrkA
MYVVLIGAGTIGTGISEFLVKSGYDVTFINLTREPLDKISMVSDVHTIIGHGCDPLVLKAAEVQKAGLVMSLTSNQEANLLAVSMAKRMGAEKTIARVRSRHYLSPLHETHRKALGIDMLISPELLTADQIMKFMDNPNMLELESYAQGLAQLVQIEVSKHHVYCGRRVMDIDLPGPVLIVLVVRDGEPLIPNGPFMIKARDKLTLLGKTETLSKIREINERNGAKDFRKAVVAGGGVTGRFIATALQHKVSSLKMLEVDADRCRVLGEFIDQANVLHGDATNRGFLLDERVGQSDLFISAMHHDEANIMSSLLAKRLGARKCVAIVKRTDYAELLQENTDIDLALSPREITIARIMKVIKSGLIHNLSLLEKGKAEIIEFRATDQSRVVETPLSEIKFPEGCLVGMISRGKSVRIPRGDDKIKAGDSVIMVLLAGIEKKVEEMFG